MTAANANLDELTILRLNLDTHQFVPLHRLPIDIELRPWVGHTQVKGRHAVLYNVSEHHIFPGPNPPVTHGRVLYIDLFNGVSGELQWPEGGGPAGYGDMLAVGGPQAVPAMSNGWSAALTVVLLLAGVAPYLRLRCAKPVSTIHDLCTSDFLHAQKAA